MRQHSRLRFRSLFRIKVWWRDPAELLGYAGDLSEGGLKLICEERQAVDSTLPLTLRLRDRDGEIRHVDLDAVCVWARENTETGYFEHGLQLGWPNTAYAELVRHMRGESAADGSADNRP